MKNAHKNGFTFAELIIVMAIIMILAAAAFTGTGAVIKGLRFGNTFNKMIFMVQRARNMAITSKGAAAEYKIKFDFETQTAELLADNSVTDRVVLGENAELQFHARNDASNIPCLNSAAIIFKKGNAETSLQCDQCGQNCPSKMTFSLEETNADQQAEPRRKSFIIHAASGIPQIQ